MKKILISLLLVSFFFSSVCFAAEVLTLSQFIETAVKTHPQYQISAEEYLIALYADKSAHSIEDWNLIASAIYQDGRIAPVSGFSSTYQNTLGYSLGVEKYFAGTGTALKIEHNNTRIRSEYPTIAGMPPGLFPTSPYYISDLSLTITQPLLKDAFGHLTKGSLKMSGYSLELAEIKLAEDWEDFISMLIGEYQTWQKRYLNVEVYTDKLKRAEEQLALVEKQRKFGLSEDLDVVQTKQTVQGYKMLLEKAKMDCETQSRKILAILGVPDSNPKEIEPQEFIKNGLILTEKESLDYLFEGSNVNKTASLLVSLQEINLGMKENEELPDVTLVLQADPNAYSQWFKDSIKEIGEYDSYMVSVNVSSPLFNDMANTESDKAKEELEKALREKEQILLESSIGVKEMFTSLKYFNGILKLNEENLKLAQDRLSLENEKYNQGRTSVFFVLQAEDALLEAENALNETLFAREAIINQIKSFTDRYLDEYKELLTIDN